MIRFEIYFDNKTIFLQCYRNMCNYANLTRERKKKLYLKIRKKSTAAEIVIKLRYD